MDEHAKPEIGRFLIREVERIPETLALLRSQHEHVIKHMVVALV